MKGTEERGGRKRGESVNCRKNINGNEPGQLGAVFSESPAFVSQVHWICFLACNGFQVHCGVSLLVFTTVRSGEETLTFSLMVL